MTTLTLDDELINQVIAKSHSQNAQEAVTKILSNYLQENIKSNFIEQLAMPEVADIDFEPPRLESLICHTVDFLVPMRRVGMQSRRASVTSHDS